jgi:hypothetical protein
MNARHRSGIFILMRILPSSKAVRAAGCMLLLFVLAYAESPPVSAASGPFAGFAGRWSGTGTIKPSDKPTERIRCDATYRPLGSSEHEVDLQLRCESDSYKFDLAGQFQADEGNHISGSFTERTRGVGGTVVGSAQSARMQIHVESSAFSATMVLTTHGRSQSVAIDAQGGGQFVKASITLHRG